MYAWATDMESVWWWPEGSGGQGAQGGNADMCNSINNENKVKFKIQ